MISKEIQIGRDRLALKLEKIKEAIFMSDEDFEKILLDLTNKSSLKELTIGELISVNARFEVENYFTAEDINLFRQWYNSIYDTNNIYLEKKDHEAYKKIMKLLNLPIKNWHPERN